MYLGSCADPTRHPPPRRPAAPPPFTRCRAPQRMMRNLQRDPFHGKEGGGGGRRRHAKTVFCIREFVCGLVCIWVHICMCTRLYNEVVPMCLVSDTDYTLRLLNIRIRFPPEKITARARGARARSRARTAYGGAPPRAAPDAGLPEPQPPARTAQV